MSAIIVTAKPEDAVLLDQLVNAAYRGESSKVGWTTEADLLDGTRTDALAISALLEDPGTTILKYVEDGKIRGCVELKVEIDKLYIGMLTVQPDLQGRGIGKELLKRAEVEAKKRKCSSMVMAVISAREELIAWYMRHGYHATGERRPFDFKDPRFGQPKRSLEFIVLEKKL